MKRAISLMLLCTICGSSAQQIAIEITLTNSVYNVLTGSPVEASEGLVACLYRAPEQATHEAELMPLGSGLPVGVIWPGVIVDGVGVRPPIDIVNQRIHVQFRVWELRFGNTYEQAVANSTPQSGRLALVGRSRIISNFRVRQNFNFLTFGPMSVRPVTSENECAQAVPGRFSTSADQPVAIALLGSDFGRSSLTYQITQLPAHGTLTGTPPHLIYTPPTGFCGLDAFSFAATDGDTACLSSNAVVEIEVCPATGKGWAWAFLLDYMTNGVTGRVVTGEDGIVGQTYWASIDISDERLFEPIGVPLPVGLPDSLPYFSDLLTLPITPSGAPANFQVRFWETAFGATYEEAVNNRQPQNGRLALVATSDIMTVTTGDPKASPPGLPGAIDIFVAPKLLPVVPPPPGVQAVPQALVTGLGQPVAIELAASEESEDLVFALTTYPLYGELTGSAPHLSYTPRPEFSGIDSFEYVASELGNLERAPEPAMVTITVDSVVRCPKAVVRVLPPAVEDDGIYWVIAPNGHRTLVLFEGTGSFQPASGVLDYRWALLPEIEHGPVTTPVKRPSYDAILRPFSDDSSSRSVSGAGLARGRRHKRVGPVRHEIVIGLGEVAGWPAPIGMHRVSLEVTDGACSSSQTINLKVLTPAGGIMRCIDVIESTAAPRKIKRTLIDVLESSLRQMGQGQVEMATRRLRQFLVKLQGYGPAELDPLIAEQWAGCVQWVIEGIADQ